MNGDGTTLGIVGVDELANLSRRAIATVGVNAFLGGGLVEDGERAVASSCIAVAVAFVARPVRVLDGALETVADRVVTVGVDTGRGRCMGKPTVRVAVAARAAVLLDSDDPSGGVKTVVEPERPIDLDGRDLPVRRVTTTRRESPVRDVPRRWGLLRSRLESGSALERHGRRAVRRHCGWHDSLVSAETSSRDRGGRGAPSMRRDPCVMKVSSA